MVHHQCISPRLRCGHWCLSTCGALALVHWAVAEASSCGTGDLSIKNGGWMESEWFFWTGNNERSPSGRWMVCHGTSPHFWRAYKSSLGHFQSYVKWPEGKLFLSWEVFWLCFLYFLGSNGYLLPLKLILIEPKKADATCFGWNKSNRHHMAAQEPIQPTDLGISYMIWYVRLSDMNKKWMGCPENYK